MFCLDYTLNKYGGYDARVKWSTYEAPAPIYKINPVLVAAPCALTQPLFICMGLQVWKMLVKIR